MLKKITQIALMGLLFLNVSCSKESNNSSGDENASPLTWIMNGQSFTAKGGKAFDSDNFISVNITPHESNCDSKVIDFVDYISVSIPKNSTSNKLNVVFNSKNKAVNALNSNVKYEYIDTNITVWIEAETINGNKATGKFTVPYCKKQGGKNTLTDLEN